MQALLHRRVRALVSLLLMVVVLALAQMRFDLDSALLVAWDVGVFLWLMLTFAMMAQANAQEASLRAQRVEPNALGVLIVVAAAAIVGYFGSIILASRSGGRTELEQTLHFAVGVLAIVGGWLLVHTQFALYYAELYYDEMQPGRPRQAEDGAALVAFRRGLEFPNVEVVDYWDFIYYAYTIAICYQTSDVTVTTPGMRRVTIVHALISFVFVTVLIGFVVNALNNLL